MVTAIIMAGGKGTRMKTTHEKPLVKVRGKYLIDYVVGNVKSASCIDKIFIATSPHTLKTQEYMLDKEYNIIETPGNGYLEDLGFLLSYFEAQDPEEILMTIAVDLPLVTGPIIDFILNEYYKSQKLAMCVVVPVEIFNKYHLEPSVVWDGIVPSGVNILRSINKIQDEEVLEVPKIELALNINSCQDIKVLERFLVIK
jgi:adenosylcobinamide-phosphate guanylyltransferase